MKQHCKNLFREMNVTKWPCYLGCERYADTPRTNLNRVLKPTSKY